MCTSYKYYDEHMYFNILYDVVIYSISYNILFILFIKYVNYY